jgi:DNA-binding CsgD family transcriptional regulator
VQGDPDNYISLLSAAQIETLRHVYEHKNSKQIARLMHVSPHTVDERVRRVLKKLNVSNRIEAARDAWRLTVSSIMLPLISL